MTAALGRQSWLPMLAMAALLASALVFLYAKTMGYDPSSYFEDVVLLRQIKQLDAQWELDAMKSKIGINRNYDPLVDPLLSLNGLPRHLHALASGQPRDYALALLSGVDAFDASLQQKADLVERFKSHNALLRISWAFLPTAAQNVENLANQDGSGNQGLSKSVAADVNRVLLASLVFDQSASDEKAAEIEFELQRIVAQKKNLSGDLSKSVDIFAAHVRAVLREHGVVNRLLTNISAAPTGQRIDAVNSILNSEQQRSSVQVQKYRQYLLLFAAALAGLFLYAAVWLIRSHSVINRINNELQLANDNLEQRVLQRTEELKEAQAQLVATARQAGMAEIATNVLHNVGNVLNSVTVSAGLVCNQVRASKISGLSKAVQLMNEHRQDIGIFFAQDPKGKMLPDYLGKLADVVTTEQKIIIDELAVLNQSIDHIREIVATQQSYAGAASVMAPFQIADVLNEALRISAASLSRHHVAIAKELDVVAVMLLDRHRVLQILVNLISNAKQAMDGTMDREHCITLRLRMAPGPVVQVQVADNGVGIAPENLARIFTHGFTTRAGGHGFGLHSCVLAAGEMGGKLTVFSEGVGKGAAFTLELPLQMRQ